MKKIMISLLSVLLLVGCGSKKQEVKVKAKEEEKVVALKEVEKPVEKKEEVVQEEEAVEEVEEEVVEAPSEPVVEEKQEEVVENTSSGIRPEFKAAMDSYEQFYDDYVIFMQEYQKNPTDLALLAKYTTMISDLEEMDKTFEAWEDEDLNNEELAYYTEVTLRIEQKLLKALQ
ncbi:MAG: hypothetical protein HUJ56_04855 [Erysipelotrichaceae bacterium]|nr:hypothetical protein [Erysipelotrichaceae bacterium]